MKAFHFRLEQALRWRTAQADLEQANTSRAAARVSALQKEIESCRDELAQSARETAAGGEGSALESWAVYSRRLRTKIGALEKQLHEAESQLGERLRILVEANRKVKLLGNLKQTGRAHWTAELDRQLDEFAGEAFLAAYNRGRLQSGKRTGA
jgi:flagellar export protein FliJ